MLVVYGPEIISGSKNHYYEKFLIPLLEKGAPSINSIWLIGDSRGFSGEIINRNLCAMEGHEDV